MINYNVSIDFLYNLIEFQQHLINFISQVDSYLNLVFDIILITGLIVFSGKIIKEVLDGGSKVVAIALGSTLIYKN
jgi:hypothetical protein